MDFMAFGHCQDFEKAPGKVAIWEGLGGFMYNKCSGVYIYIYNEMIYMYIDMYIHVQTYIISLSVSGKNSWLARFLIQHSRDSP